MRRSGLCLIPCLLVPTLLVAQRPTLGLAVGWSFVGNSDSRIVVPAVTGTLTGADRAGLHVRAMTEWPLGTPALRFRTELFYNRLTSNAWTRAVVGDDLVATARRDRTLGFLGTFVASPYGGHTVAPYFVLGVGAFQSHLAGAPSADPDSAWVARDGMGLGVQTGLGLQVRLGTPCLLVEWRYGQALNGVRGVGFMPVTLGLAF
jgi:hypothetical protein